MYDQPHRLFTEPVWYKPDEPDQVPLFDPVTRQNQQETAHDQVETALIHSREKKTKSAVVVAVAIGHDSRNPQPQPQRTQPANRQVQAAATPEIDPSPRSA